MIQQTEEKYKLLIQQIEGILNDNDPIITNFSNFIAAINQTFSKISWIGFYIKRGDTLFLGPFQGKVACTKIKIGNGVCGASAKLKETIIVEDVNKFSGHIACDVESKSEIVVPIVINNDIYAVLDLDSTDYSSFEEIDKIWLEKICKLLVSKLKLNFNLLN